MWLTLCVIVTADLRLAAACGSRLDREVMEILSGGDDTRKQGRRLSLRKRYLTFAWETGAIPVFPTKHTAFFRYALYLSQTGVESGFDGVGKYITEVVRWNQEWGYPDFRETQYYWWDRQAKLRWCPLMLLQQHVKRTYNGRPEDFIFRSAKGSPLPRATHINTAEASRGGGSAPRSTRPSTCPSLRARPFGKAS